MLLDQIPGLLAAERRAKRKEEELRRRAYLPCHLRICGIPVRAFTPRHFILLDEARSPLIGYPGAILPEHIAQFLWLVSTEFLLPTHQVPLRRVKAACSHFTQKKSAKMKYGRALKKIREYIEEAWFDGPSSTPGSSDDDAPYASFVAHLVERFPNRAVATYDDRGQPVPEGGTLDRPFAQLFQEIRVRTVSENPKYVPPNRLSDAMARIYVLRYDERLKRRAEAKAAKVRAGQAVQASGNRQGEGG